MFYMPMSPLQDLADAVQWPPAILALCGGLTIFQALYIPDIVLNNLIFTSTYEQYTIGSKGDPPHKLIDK